LHRRDIDEAAGARPDRRLERHGRHEPIADDGDFRDFAWPALIRLLFESVASVQGSVIRLSSSSAGG
jgi:hypothetical protein